MGYYTLATLLSSTFLIIFCKECILLAMHNLPSIELGLRNFQNSDIVEP
jgi:hypothetical protein